MGTSEKVSAVNEAFGFPERKNESDHDKAVRVANAINALTVEFPDGGWLSTLVWNTRNSYMAFPDMKFDAAQMQMIIEGFLTEVELLRAPLGTD